MSRSKFDSAPPQQPPPSTWEPLSERQTARLLAQAMLKHAPEALANERVTEQPPPKASEGPAVWELVLADMQARNAEGVRKYGTPLRPHNGRDALIDAYQEALDLCVYLRQAIFEQGNPAS